MHQLHRRGDGFHWSVRENPMTKVKDVPSTTSSPLENILHPSLDLVERGKQDDRVQIPLDRRIVSNHRPGLVQMHPPVHADDVAACLPHEPKQGRRACAEVDEGDAFMLQSVEDELDMRQYILGIIAWR